MRKISNIQVQAAANTVAEQIIKGKGNDTAHFILYGVPRGGIPAAYAVQAALSIMGFSCEVTDDASQAHIIIDDLIDSGATKSKYFNKYAVPFCALFDKSTMKNEWLIFPWEETSEGAAEDIPTRLLQFIGEDPQRGGLLETPKRFLKAWSFWTKGYKENPEDVLKVFEDGAEKYNQMVLVKDIPIASHCEHHMAPFWGKAHIAYIPDGKVVGLSKLSRLADIFSRRLQVQERLTDQIAEALQKHLEPKGVGVILQCRHSCMEFRGILRAGAVTVTSSLQGVFMEDEKVRDEYLKLVGMSDESKL